MLTPEEREERMANIARLIGFIDLTSLRGNDTEERVALLCEKARYPINEAHKQYCAAVCVWPNFAQTAAEKLNNTSVKVACVAGGFPFSQTSIHVKTTEVREAIKNGADEIDYPINRSLILHDRLDELLEEIQAVREASAKATLKIIIETCDLPSKIMIKKACDIAMAGGADFLKTSTGMGPKGATLENAQILFRKALDWKRETGKHIGVKASGGVRHVEEALAYMEMADHYFGKATRENFRIGASSLLKDCLVHLSSSAPVNVKAEV